MDPASLRMFMAAGGSLPPIGEAYQGGYVGGYISHTANSVPTHILIVAPASTGEGTSLSWKTSNTSTAGTTSTFDGFANTQAMVTAGIADHPAAEFCVNLTIGGYTDWYLPARLELDIAYFHLKPTTDNNVTTLGINAYSVPERTVNYTTTDPARTSIALYQSGGGEDFFASLFSVLGANRFYRASTETSATGAPAVAMGDGGSVNVTKSSSLRVRAFRKVAL
jgi:hypothetical protein